MIVMVKKVVLMVSEHHLRFWAAAPKETQSCRTQGRISYISIRGYVCPSVCRSVRLLVRNQFCNQFLDGSTHLYMRVCPSVGRMVGPSVGWSVRRSVMRFFKCQKWTIFFMKIIGAVQL